MSFDEKLSAAIKAAPSIAIGDAFWYLALAGVLWLTFFVVLKKAFGRRKIARESDPTAAQIRREILCSMRSLAIFGLVGGIVVFAALSGWTRMYRHFEAYRWTWFLVSVGIIVVLHDTYFYWTHRLMHHPRLFRAFHRTHHLSHSPTPWAAYAFSPWEAVVQAGIGPLIAFTMPVHPTALFVFMIWQLTFNVFGHCGHEIFPSWFLKTWAGKILNTPTHHAMHHEKFRSNYGLYFNLWDQLMGTNHPQYDERFAQVTGPKAT